MQLKMNRKYVILGLAAICFLSCKQKEEAVKSPITNEIPEDFVSFYEQFHLDTAYQVDHIMFPLEGMPSLDPNSDLNGFTFWWERIGWKYHKPYDDQNGTYSRSFSNFGGIITEHIRDNSGQFTMMRRFSKMDDEWMLIYYKQMGR